MYKHTDIQGVKKKTGFFISGQATTYWHEPAYRQCATVITRSINRV